MKILLTIHHPLDPNAGAPSATLKLGQEYKKLGHQVDYFSFDQLPRSLPELAKMVLFPEFLTAYLDRNSNRFDVIDASTGDAWIWAQIWSKLWKSRQQHPILVTRNHGLEHIMHLEYLEEGRLGKVNISWKYPLYHGGWRLWEVATSLRCADRAFFLNQRDLNYAVEQLGVSPAQACLVTNGIPASFLNLPFDPGLADAATVQIAQVGSYIPRKGIHYGASALNTILSRHPQVEVSFFGTGCSEAEVHNDFAPGLRDRIQVVPHYSHEKLADLLKGHQIKLFPTLSEGFSLALTEAMACGLAPIATATPGPLEIVEDGKNGLLIPPRESQAIEQALERLITDLPYLSRLRHQAYDTAQHYSWTRVAHENLALYQEVLMQNKEIQNRKTKNREA